MSHSCIEYMWFHYPSVCDLHFLLLLLISIPQLLLQQSSLMFSEEWDNPSASSSPVVWVRVLPGALMGSWRELFPTGLSKKQREHKPWSGREGNKYIDLKGLNYFFSLSFFPCPHGSITRRAKGGNVLIVAGVSVTESFSYCANKPEVSSPPNQIGVYQLFQPL